MSCILYPSFRSVHGRSHYLGGRDVARRYPVIARFSAPDHRQWHPESVFDLSFGTRVLELRLNHHYQQPANGFIALLVDREAAEVHNLSHVVLEVATIPHELSVRKRMKKTKNPSWSYRRQYD
ncbi:MAG: hypothetical protein JW384_02987 [Nitrosomonadaceae bacterium]|nr:hypothetical protein [Nitrosomonadaceae bacterium]